TYTDFDDNERTEDFYFHLSKAEIAEMELSENGGLVKLIEKIIMEQDGKRIAEIFKDLLLKAYGEKSLDGRRFVKSQELRDAFEQTNAYSELYIELATNAEAASEFFNKVIPKSLK
ncbi:MAG TPA: hypothetical protein VFD57_03640, partial [Clostridia bacterium]|nr:hypothetical protein [Clostridia bacterium]